MVVGETMIEEFYSVKKRKIFISMRHATTSPIHNEWAVHFLLY